MDFTDAVSEFLVFLIRIVFSIVLPRDENRGGLFMFAESLCCFYTGNRIRPFCFAPVIGFMGATPYVQKSMVGLSVYNGPYRAGSVVSPLWCRVLPHGSTTPQGDSLYGPVVDVQWSMRDSWNPPVFPVGCFPFFFCTISIILWGRPFHIFVCKSVGWIVDWESPFIGKL